MIRKYLVLPLLVLAAASPARSPVSTVSEDALRRHIEVLASDAMEGRKPGTEGGSRAALYISGQFRELGLQPGGRDGGWYHPVRLVERAPVQAKTRWTVAGKEVAIAADQLVLTGREPGVKLGDAPIVFAGHGLDLPEQGRRDLDGVDVTGAVVLLMPGAPRDIGDAPALETRRQAILKRGAAAVLTAVRPSDPWAVIRDQLGEGRTILAGDPVGPVEGAIAYPAWTRLLTAAGQDPGALITAAATPGFRARPLGGRAAIEVTTRVRSFETPNVIARLPGTRPGSGSLLFLAHYDHLGLCRPEGAPDRICNGAVDNASGVALMIEVARGLAAGPRPQRDILFMATTAEEYGLIGARAFVQNPTVPRGSIVAAFNFDTVAIAPRGMPVAVIGRGMTALDPIIDRAARRLRRRVDKSLAANAFVTRQDGWALLKEGVPAVMVGGSFANTNLLTAFLTGPYHQPIDDLKRPLVLGGAAEDGDLHIAIARVVGDPARFPAARR